VRVVILVVLIAAMIPSYVVVLVRDALLVGKQRCGFRRPAVLSGPQQ
jgi:hypothetical protein